MEYLSLICWVSAAICNAIMDTLSHHYHTSIFSKLNPKFWNPTYSWRNKYKDGVVANGPAFYLSTGVLVAFTDAWHFFKSLQIVLLGTAVVLFPYSSQICFFKEQILNVIVQLILLGVMWNVPFSIMYNRILKK